MENSGCDPNGDVDPKYYVAQMDLNNDIAENSYGLEITEDTLKGTLKELKEMKLISFMAVEMMITPQDVD